MFRRKLHIGDTVIIKKTKESGIVVAIHGNPYIPWNNISSYGIKSNTGISCYSRKELKKL